MKNTLKRGLALFLAVALMAKSGAFTLDGSLKAAAKSDEYEMEEVVEIEASEELETIEEIQKDSMEISEEELGEEDPEEKAEESGTVEAAVIAAASGNLTAASAVTVTETGNAATFVPTITNANVVYCFWNSESDLDDVTLNSVTSGSNFSINAFTTETKPGYIVFFAKPASGYLLTTLSGGEDYYNIDGPYYNIYNYPGLSTIVAAAKAQGYVACFGYSRKASQTFGSNAIATVEGKAPGLTVTAESDQTTNVRPGTELTLTITVVPDTAIDGKNLTVTNVNLAKLTINGTETDMELTSNGDGTYTGTMKYTVTDQNYADGSIDIAAKASVDYSYSLGMTDQNNNTSNITTNVTTVNTGSAKCDIAPKGNVTYKYNYVNAAAGKISAAPTVVKNQVVETKTYYYGDNVTVQPTPAGANVKVVDENNNGYWTFDGWYLGTEKVTASTVRLTVDKLNFTGTWTFHAYKIATVTANSLTVTYDGKTHEVSGFENQGSDGRISVTIDGETYYVTGIRSKASGIMNVSDSVSAITVTGTASVQNSNGTDVTDQFRVNINQGSLTIEPKAVTITANSGEFVYTGQAQQAVGKDGKLYTVSGLIGNDAITATVSGSITNVSQSPVTATVTAHSFDAGIAGNYAVSYVSGTLTMKEYSGKITVTTTGGSFTYDGKAHGATVSVSGLPTGYTLETAASSAAATDVTTEAVIATCDTLVIKNAAGEDVTSKLNITKVDGSIAITPATLTVRTPNASKTYDGTALKASGSIKGFVNGETATFTMTGSQTAVGSSNNTYSITWDGTAKESNYTIKETIGKLKVIARSTSSSSSSSDDDSTTPTDPTPTPDTPVTPAPPAPVAPTPSTPTGGGGTAAAVVDAQIAEVPGAEETAEITDDNEELIEIEDTEVPLANIDADSDDHTCCALHVIFMALAFVVLGFYTHSRKKHQKRIFELREKLGK
jgi:hypothetical protein